MDAGKISIVLLIAVAIAGCIDEQPETIVETSSGLTVWTPDGVIAADEYTKSLSVNDGRYVIHWKSVNDTVYFGLETTSPGWAGIGFGPTNRMQDADIVLGGIADNVPYLFDMYSTGPTGPHPPDTEQGGTDDVLLYGAEERMGGTVLEFSRKTDTGDVYDNVLTPGKEITIIWAQADSDEPFFRHNIGKGTTTIVL
ncbi:DOMON domain-containing protein [Methanogenium cariaci]|jgi:DOMON domain-containing protein|uniref:DOMON domain-containing protein n=1 Tax=Methanogenium cariaci TaxID=2197 RepID=UPI00078241A1|nr:DOMON domain-containing protein [Methanogenium cariaci]